MKIYINSYRDHWISPYTIIDRVFWWTDWSRCHRWSLKDSLDDELRPRSRFVERPEWAERWADRFMPLSLGLQYLLDLVHPKINYVHIDRWDTWSMDHTLAEIVLPMLRQLQETKHGSPLVADEDVPEHLRSTAAPPRENEWDTDTNHHARWDWVLDEMIFAFDKKCQDDWTAEFHSGESDLVWLPVDRDGNEVDKKDARYFEMKRGPNDSHKWDQEGQQKVQDRISNGFRLFGKYYEALWD